VWLARLQFALTVGFHYLFPPLSIGLSWMIVYFLARHRKTGDEAWRQTARFWTRLFAVTFAVGVASGITMEFQFGTNWAAYSRFVGDIFGAPLAAEGVFAFFLESSFLGVLLYGENRVSRRVYEWSAVLVALGATLSAFWIIVANSWQQTPAGFELVNGRAELTSFWQAAFNPSTLPRYAHTVAGALVTGTLFVLGCSAWLLLKGRHVALAERSLRAAVLPFALSVLLSGVLGHHHAVQVARTQPVKLAAFEGLWETQKSAPLLLFGVPNESAGRTDFAVAIPGGLSLLVGLRTDTEVAGLNAVPKEDRPPLAPTFWSFHGMVYLFGWLALLAVFALVAVRGRDLAGNRLFLRAAAWSLPVPFIANELGWFAAEIGRQPWVVYNLMRTRDAVSAAVPAGQILASIILFSVIYSALFALWLFLLNRQLTAGVPGPAREEARS
jgi:cytochrome d ubiquinol oxidase subunit I